MALGYTRICGPARRLLNFFWPAFGAGKPDCGGGWRTEVDVELRLAIHCRRKRQPFMNGLTVHYGAASSPAAQHLSPTAEDAEVMLFDLA
jgi:hypothetical protein